MTGLRTILTQGLALAAEDKFTDAVAELQNGLKKALQQGAAEWIILFARNLGLLYDHKGDLKKAERYYRIALESNITDPSLHYMLGTLYARLGRPILSRRYLATCRDLAVKSGDKDFLEIFGKEDRRLRQ